MNFPRLEHIVHKRNVVVYPLPPYRFSFPFPTPFLSFFFFVDEQKVSEGELSLLPLPLAKAKFRIGGYHSLQSLGNVAQRLVVTPKVVESGIERCGNVINHTCPIIL